MTERIENSDCIDSIDSIDNTGKDCVIVVSGGMDSVTLMWEMRRRIALAVTFDYGSNHNAREIECARRNCAILGIEHLVIPLAFMGEYFRMLPPATNRPL